MSRSVEHRQGQETELTPQGLGCVLGEKETPNLRSPREGVGGSGWALYLAARPPGLWAQCGPQVLQPGGNRRLWACWSQVLNLGKSSEGVAGRQQPTRPGPGALERQGPVSTAKVQPQSSLSLSWGPTGLVSHQHPKLWWHCTRHGALQTLGGQEELEEATSCFLNCSWVASAVT